MDKEWSERLLAQGLALIGDVADAARRRELTALAADAMIRLDRADDARDMLDRYDLWNDSRISRLAECCARLGRMEEAFALADRRADICRDEAVADLAAERCLLGDVPGALAVLRRMNDQGQTTLSIHLVLEPVATPQDGEALAEAAPGVFAAVAAWAQLAEKFPDRAAGYIARGEALIDDNPDLTHNLLKELVEAAAEIGDRETALRLFRRGADWLAARAETCAAYPDRRGDFDEPMVWGLDYAHLAAALAPLAGVGAMPSPAQTVAELSRLDPDWRKSNGVIFRLAKAWQAAGLAEETAAFAALADGGGGADFYARETAAAAAARLSGDAAPAEALAAECDGNPYGGVFILAGAAAAAVEGGRCDAAERLMTAAAATFARLDDPTSRYFAGLSLFRTPGGSSEDGDSCGRLTEIALTATLAPVAAQAASEASAHYHAMFARSLHQMGRRDAARRFAAATEAAALAAPAPDPRAAALLKLAEWLSPVLRPGDPPYHA